MTNFVEKFYLQNLSVCNEIIDFFESHPEKTSGMVSSSEGSLFLDNTTKNCTEVVLDNNEQLYWKYVNSLQVCCEEYVIKYPFSNSYSPWRICEGINIQKYQPRESFNAYHTERIGRNGLQSSRHLVFMTYLNTVNTGGETEFYHQQLFVKPEKGLTVIWPADWTHTHRGIPAPQETKYIVTGWYNYVD
jgi:hypothetical protein